MEYSILKPPPETDFNFLSLGAGVQSSVLALMAAKGLITPMPDAAIFADTEAEPKVVYEWLSWLEKQLPFPVYRVSNGSLEDKALEMHTTKDGRRFSKCDIPIFTLNANGEKGMVPNRKCTSDFKIVPVKRKVKELASIKRGQKEITVTQYIGISWDEIQRMRESRDKWQQLRYPLIEMRMTRRDCIEWMLKNGYPEPPRSSCVFCPFHNDTEWRRLRDHDPEGFQRAVEFDKKLRALKTQTDNFKTKPFLHASLKPLDEVDFDSDVDKGQELMDFMWECEGMCGL